MPYTPKQHRLFEFAKNNPKAAAQAGFNIPKATAAKMASEGIKKSPPKKGK